jgi:hypothetical protein
MDVGKKIVMAKSKILSQSSPGGTKENHKSLMIASLQVEI